MVYSRGGAQSDRTRRARRACAGWSGGIALDCTGELARSNGDQLRKIRTILKGLSLEVASPDEARALLDLKGGDDVNF